MANKAAWLPAAKVTPFEIKDAPMPEPEPNDIVVKTRAVAINPVDAGVQRLGILVKSYPMILGTDVAGEVHAVGSAVTRFKVGDRVIGSCDGIERDRAANCSFQLYCATDESLFIKIPPQVSYAQGSVISLGFITAAGGMYDKRHMALPAPSLDPKPNGKIFLVWGGASSVGSCAIQLAKASGYTVATTASAHNATYCKALGAEYVYDYKTADVEQKIIAELQGKEFGGAFNAIITPPTIFTCARIASSLGGYKCVGTVLPDAMPFPEGGPPDVRLCKVNGAETAVYEGGKYVWQEWAPAALASGLLRCLPEPEIVGHGLESVQAACDRMSQGVSATKLVVEIA